MNVDASKDKTTSSSSFSQVRGKRKVLGLGQPILRFLEFESLKGAPTSEKQKHTPFCFNHYFLSFYFLLVLELIPSYISFKPHDSPMRCTSLSSCYRSPFCRWGKRKLREIKHAQ